MEYQVEIKNIESIKVAYMKYKGVVTEANKVFERKSQKYRKTFMMVLML